MKKLSDFELGYLCGFIDGEGALLINKREHICHCNGRRYMSYSCYLDLCNTNRDSLVWIKNLLDVTSEIYENNQPGNRKPVYRLRICYRQAKPLVELLKDRFIVKKKIAAIFLRYGTEKDKSALFEEAKIVNHRGL